MVSPASRDDHLAGIGGHPRGGADYPLTGEELRAKFRGNAGVVLPAARIDRIIAEVAGLDRASRLDGLMEALT